ncbi:MAG: WG repeat-containing protein [Bacteroidales bacterium]|jgi:hypothetical protein|nr:WG repeat-containing protein [Bacteroidales bacterium]
MEFHGGLAAVKTIQGLWGYIDKKGTMVITPKFYRAGNLTDGYALVNNLKSDPVSHDGYFYINTIRSSFVPL